MQLFHSPASPFVRKVRVLLHESGRSEEVTLIDPLADPTDMSHVMPANPLGKLPTLVRPDGPALYDSRVICRYRDATFGTGLYPETRLWEVLTLEATGDGMLDSGVLMVYEHRFRPEDMVHAPWIERHWGKIAGALDAIEQRWMPHLAGPLDMGHISLGCALGYLDFRHDARDWRTGRTALAAWYDTFAERPSMLENKPAA